MSFLDVAEWLRLRNEGVRRFDNWSGDFWTAKVDRVPLPGRGHGLVASDRVLRGERVGACRALAVVYDDEVEEDAMNLALIQQLQTCRGETLRLLCSLCSASSDEFNVARGTRIFDQDGLPIRDAVVPDNEQLMQIIRLNSDETWCFTCAKGQRRRVRGSLLFGRPAWQNHAFDANVVALVVCDGVQLLACRDIKKGEEVTRSYITWSWDEAALTRTLGRYGVALEPELPSRLLPHSALTHAAWRRTCAALAAVEANCLSRDADLSQYSKLLRLLRGAEPLNSAYLQMRRGFLAVAVETRRGELTLAVDEATTCIDLLRHAEPPAGEFAQYCTVLLLLCAALRATQRANKLPPLLAAIRAMLQAFLSIHPRALEQWFACWFGEMMQQMQPLVAQMLVPIVELDSMD